MKEIKVAMNIKLFQHTKHNTLQSLFQEKQNVSLVKDPQTTAYGTNLASLFLYKKFLEYSHTHLFSYY